MRRNDDELTSFALAGKLSPAQITADQNNYSPTGLNNTALLRLSTDASRNLTGLAGGRDGRIIVVHNVGSFNVVLVDESGSSTAANRFALTADITMTPDSVVFLQYDTTSQRWRAVSGGGGGGTWGSITGTLSSQTDLQSALDAKQNLISSPTNNDIVTTNGSGQTQDSGKSFDTDGTLAGNSDNKIATQKAVKTYVDTAVTGLLEFKGSTDCSTNPNYPSALKGDAYIVAVAGKIGGASGKSVEVGDVYVASADNAGGTEASVGTSWFVLEHNLVGALLSANNLSDLANAGTARTNLGATTVGGNIFTVSNPSAVRYLKVNADNTVTLRSSTEFVATDLAEDIQDLIGAMVSGNTETGITVTYQDGDGTIDFEINLNNGNAVLSSVFSITGTAGTYQDTGLSITLPSAGTYIVYANVRGNVKGNAGALWWLHCELYNATDAAAVTNSEFLIVLTNTTGATLQNTATLVIPITVAASKTINLYAARNGTSTPSWTVSGIESDTNGRTSMGYYRITK